MRDTVHALVTVMAAHENRGTGCSVQGIGIYLRQQRRFPSEDALPSNTDIRRTSSNSFPGRQSLTSTSLIPYPIPSKGSWLKPRRPRKIDLPASLRSMMLCQLWDGAPQRETRSHQHLQLTRRSPSASNPLSLCDSPPRTLKILLCIPRRMMIPRQQKSRWKKRNN